ncbi:MAG: hypothetical protein JSS43_02485 [Proteobacteria bacterium]|nr:hypothetical protein [Pseudomonadota bacterium]
MTTGIGSVGIGGYGTTQQLTGDSASIRARIALLTDQASSGLVSRNYAGLGDSATTVLNLDPQLSELKTWKANVDQAAGTMTVTQTAMKRLQSIAASFLADTNNLNSLSSSEVNSVAANARSTLREVANLLDTQNGNVYVFAGQDSANPPVPSPDAILSSGFYTQINSAIAALSTNGAAATIATTLSVAGSNAPGTSPFSGAMSQPASTLRAPVLQVGEGQTVQFGMFASANTAAVSDGTSTTGSYTRDLMRALATLGSLSSAQIEDANFAPLVDDTRTSLRNAITAMATDVGVMGDRQRSLTDMQTQLSDTEIALTGQISNVRDADLAKTLSELTQLNTQLQASYQLLATQSSLSLVKFLSAS